MVIGKDFAPDCALPKVRDIIHCHNRGPWIRFSQVPSAERRIWFLEFKKRYFWDESMQEAVMAIWKMKASEHLMTIFYKARMSGKKPRWIADQHWTLMLQKWADDVKFRKHSEINKQN